MSVTMRGEQTVTCEEAAVPSSPTPAVTVRVPASSANLGPGFDSVGLALGVWDEYDVAFTGRGPLRIEVSGEGSDEVPLDERHLVYRAMRYAWGRLGVAVPEGVVLYRPQRCAARPGPGFVGIGHRRGSRCRTGLFVPL